MIISEYINIKYQSKLVFEKYNIKAQKIKNKKLK